MVSQVIGYCVSIFITVWTWFSSVLNSTGGLVIWVTALVIHACFKFIISPVFGSCKSDIAKKSYNAFKRRKEE